MKTKFLQRKRCATLAVFFCGWGVDEQMFSRLALPKNRDLLFVGRYRADDDYSFPELAPSEYERIDVAAWSLGVRVAAEVLRNRPDIRNGRRVAIAGSTRPYGAEFGIAADVFDGTIENWRNSSARENFYRRVFGRRDAVPPELLDVKTPGDSPISPTELQTELMALRNLASRPFVSDFQPFDVAVLCERDRIFPIAALERFWSPTDAEIRRISAPHSPFSQLDAWDEVFE